jgi:hypothetical protein
MVVIRVGRSLRVYGWLIVILLAAVVFFPGPGYSRAIGAAHDFAHAPVFGIVCIVLLAWMRAAPRMRALGLAQQYALAIGIASVLGIATEVAQAFTNRDASWVDVRSDILGACAFAGMFAAFDRRVERRALAIAGCVLGVAAMIWHSLPLAVTAWDYARREREFPVLLAGESVARNGFLEGMGANVAQRVLPAPFARTPDEQALHLQFVSGQWLGVAIIEPSPDWSGYRMLSLDLANPGDAPLPVTLRVHDRAHDQRYADRFNRAFVLEPRQRTTLTIPLAEIERAPGERSLDLENVAGFVLFTTQEHAGRDLYVSRIWLSRPKGP